MTEFIHDPGNTEPIDTLYAFLSLDEGGEGICSGIIPVLGSTPLVTSKLSTIDLIRPIAEKIARATGKQVRLVKFTRAEVLEVITTHECQK